MIIVKYAYDKFNLSFKSKYVLQVINAVEGFEKLKYVPKGGFTWDDVRNAAAVNCGDKRSVSYTHLDVYKRQVLHPLGWSDTADNNLRAVHTKDRCCYRRCIFPYCKPPCIT